MADHNGETSSDAYRTPPTTDAEKLASIRAELGFFPQSGREFSLVSSALKGYWNEGITGASERGRFLKDIEWHQYLQTAEGDASGALHAVVKDMEAFASDTVGTRTAVKLVGETLQGESDQKLLAEVTHLSGWKDQRITERGLEQLARRLAIDKHIESGSEDKVPIDKLSTEAAVEEMLAQTMVFEALPIISETAEEQTARRIFWIEQLTQAANHPIVDARAKSALLRLNPPVEP